MCCPRFLNWKQMKAEVQYCYAQSGVCRALHHFFLQNSSTVQFVESNFTGTRVCYLTKRMAAKKNENCRGKNIQQKKCQIAHLGNLLISWLLWRCVSARAEAAVSKLLSFEKASERRGTWNPSTGYPGYRYRVLVSRSKEFLWPSAELVQL